MIISKIYNNSNKEVKEGLLLGLAIGLILGLILGLNFVFSEGLVWGINWGIIEGLIGGLAIGLLFGLVLGLIMGFGGLVAGLVGGLVYVLVRGLIVILFNRNEALPYLSTLNSFETILIFVFLIIALSEVIFWLQKNKVKKGVNVFWYYCKKRIESIFEVILGLSGLAQIYIILIS